jgi:geranyl-CoA carboxylase beta subunit
MLLIGSPVNRADPAVEANRQAMLALVEAVEAARDRVIAHAERSREKFADRGQLLPRDRLGLLLDRNTPFLEVSPLAGLGMHDDDGRDKASGGGSIAGIGWVSGTRCVVFAHEAGIKGGSISPMGLKKLLRTHDLARQNRLPLVTLAESAGANLRYQSEMFVEGGRIFKNQAQLSALGIPQITVVHGSSTAGGAYLPGLSDYVIAVQERAAIFLAGPPLLKAATGEEAKAEELGGADMHAHESGLVEYLARDDADGIRLAREVVAKLGWASSAPTSQGPPPTLAEDELLDLVPQDYRTPYDVREVIARTVDASDFLEFKPDFGPQTVCGHAQVAGRPVGIIGNNGPIYPQGAAKAAQFIQACCQSGIPITYLMNTSGYIVGKEAEQQGVIKHGSKMIQAVANATVPQITFLIGGGFGAGYYGMCGRCFDPRFLFAWPNSRVAVMGGEQAGRVLRIIAEDAAARRGQAPDSEKLAAMEQATIDQIEAESTALFATAHMWDDGIIDPRDTRRVWAECLQICAEAEARSLQPNTFGVGRM